MVVKTKFQLNPAIWPSLGGNPQYSGLLCNNFPAERVSNRMRLKLGSIWWVITIIASVTISGIAASPTREWQTNSNLHPVNVTRAEWHDPSRNRTVPVKIYAPTTITTEPSPLIIFSHGLGGSREGYEYLGQFWAAQGYVSIHLQHPGSDESVWQDAGLGQRMNAMRRAAAQPRHALDRVQDVSFAIDELTRLNATNAAWRGKLDLHRIGMAGHSFGAHTTLTIAGAVYAGWGTTTLADPRVKAAIPMSAPVPANQARLEAAFAGVNIPCLHMTGTKDDSPIGDTKAAERRLPFDHCRNSDQYLITFTDGDHAIFGGRERRIGGRKDAEFQRLICQSSLAFWDAYLQNDAAAKRWLTTKFENALGKTGVFEMKPANR
jgi:dienelactone hydrolase